MTHLTGSQHYREAERLLHLAKARLDADWANDQVTSGFLLAAQVHATLSVASALSQGLLLPVDRQVA